MDTKIRHVEGVTVLDLSGRITLGEASGQLRSAVQEALSAGSKKILLNLADVNYIDSAGLGELVSAFTTVKNAGGDLKLLSLTKKVKDLLVITKLLTVFDVKENEKEAIASFAEVLVAGRFSVKMSSSKRPSRERRPFCSSPDLRPGGYAMAANAASAASSSASMGSRVSTLVSRSRAATFSVTAARRSVPPRSPATPEACTSAPSPALSM